MRGVSPQNCNAFFTYCSGVLALDRTTDDFVRLTGGFRPGETHVELRKRIDEIVVLESELKDVHPGSEDAERIKQRLRELKSFDCHSPSCRISNH